MRTMSVEIRARICSSGRATFATQAHQRIDHRRKYSQQPYDVHLGAVAELVATVSDDAEMLAAAWLHDIVEDTPVTLEEVEREFGPGVASLVKELTDVSRPGDGNRAARKAIDRGHLAIASPRAKTIKLADLCDNARDICRRRRPEIRPRLPGRDGGPAGGAGRGGRPHAGQGPPGA
jgi:(p)ppGpp synthase/HD superfamily hydrolase